MITVIYGGCGSGKSDFAEGLICQESGRKRKIYLATMQNIDEETNARISRHRLRRVDKGFVTIECPTDIEKSICQLSETDAVLLECMSNLVANEMFANGLQDEQSVTDKILSAIDSMAEMGISIYIVTNNLFEDGTIYAGEMEEYMQCLAKVNQSLVVRADRAVEVVAGIPVWLKGKKC